MTLPTKSTPKANDIKGRRVDDSPGALMQNKDLTFQGLELNLEAPWDSAIQDGGLGMTATRVCVNLQSFSHDIQE